MRILVIGGSGLVGSHVLREAELRGCSVLGTFRQHSTPGLLPLDLDDSAALVRLLESTRPDWVVHAAGWTWVDGCENDPARALRENCEQPAELARRCAERGIRLVYFSSAYVFNGRASAFGEEDAPDPINVYGRSKLAAEKAITEITGRSALIPRVICVWGREAQQKNFACQVLRAVRTGAPMTIPSDQRGNPTWAGDIAAWVMDLVQAGESGLWHLAGEFAGWTREDWLRAILHGLRVQGESGVEKWNYRAIPTQALGQPALRPLNAGLLNAAIQRRFPRVLRHPSDLKGLVL